MTLHLPALQPLAKTLLAEVQVVIKYRWRMVLVRNWRSRTYTLALLRHCTRAGIPHWAQQLDIFLPVSCLTFKLFSPKVICNIKWEGRGEVRVGDYTEQQNQTNQKPIKVFFSKIVIFHPERSKKKKKKKRKRKIFNQTETAFEDRSAIWSYSH